MSEASLRPGPDRAHVVAALRSAPGLLHAITAGVPPERLAAAPRAGEWSIAEVVAHLRAADHDGFLPRLRRMIRGDRPVFERAAEPAHPPGDVPTMVMEFGQARAHAVAMVSDLDEAGWRREGVSPSRGVVDVEAYTRIMVDHDTEHLRQIQDVRAALGLTPRRCEARIALPIAELVAILAGTAERITAVAAGLDAGRLRHRPAHGEWSIKEIISHLLDLEREVFFPRLCRMRDEEDPAFEAFDPEEWAQRRDHREGDFMAELAAFARERHATIAWLQGLPAEAGDRRGHSAYFGPVTLLQYATHVADHDLEHLDQMRECRAVALGSHG